MWKDQKMQITNREEYKQIDISKLGLSTRCYNSLMRAHYTTLYMLIENYDNLPDLRNLGGKSLAEIEELLKRISQNEISLPQPTDCETAEAREETETTEDTALEETTTDRSLPEMILSRPVTDLNITIRIFNAFQHEGIKTIGQALELKPTRLLHMKNMGTLSVQQLQEQLSLLRDLGEDYFETDYLESGKEQGNKRELDNTTAKKLQDEYGLKVAWLCDWYHVSKQRISQKLTGRKNRGKWCGKQLLEDERRVITEMINIRSFFTQNDGKAYYLLNNRTDDCAFLIVSDEEIKCFFLADLPEALQALTKSQNLHRLTEAECGAMDSLGHTVSILKKPHFMPYDTEKYRALASARGLSQEEYAQFLFALPCCSPKTSVTDERIIAFFKENTVNGRTYIPATADNQWIRSYISRSPYNTDQFLALYGFSATGDPDAPSLTLSAEDLCSVEPDMQDYSTGSDYLEKMYASTPLLGSRILSQKNLDTLNRNSRKLIEYYLNNPSAKPDLKSEMQITLAVINYAKDWDTEDESGFWRFIASQFGFRDERGQLRNLLSGCVKDALLKNRRWFVINSAGNQYKSTIVAHAFSPRRSWLYFCDFLFDFYKTNLNWEYIEDDPMIMRMVLAVRNKLRNADDAVDEALEISSKVYNFRESIIKLIIHRPRYAAQLASSLIKRIDSLVNHTAAHAATYEEQLCDQWMTGKLQGIAASKRKSPSEQRRNVAIDYTRIKPIYQLENESEIQIVFPDVRLAQNDFSSLRLSVLHDHHVVEQKSLSYYGNELGKTMLGFTLNLEDYLRRSNSDTFDPRIIISCDSEEIYDSEKVLHRKWLVFRNKTETDMGSCEPGGWSIFVPGDKTLAFENAEVSTIKETGCLKAVFAKLEKDFVVYIDGEPVAFDNALDSEELRITVSGGDVSADYLADGMRYRVINDNRTIYILSSSREGEKKYRLAVNNELVDLESLPYEESAGARRYRLEIGKQDKEEVSVRLIDLANNRLMLRRDFKRIPGFAFHFDKPFYFSSEDYNDAKLSLQLEMGAAIERPFTRAETRIRLPYQEGELDIPVPIIKVIDTAGVEWDGENLSWIGGITQDRFLHVKAPTGLGLSMQLDGQSIGTESPNAFALGNAIYGYSNAGERDRLEVRLSVSQQGQAMKQYCLGYVAVKEQFVEKPRLTYEGSKLCWDSGGGFIGDNAGRFKLTICEGTEFEKSYTLKINEELIDDELRLPIGEYPYIIQKQSGNLFNMKMVTLTNGSLFVGDVNELRFLNRIIQIDTITFENDSRYEAVKIRPCYIDRITYKGIRYVLSEERECPVYGGILFFVSEDGKRHEYSYRDGRDEKGRLLYQINPVKIVFINDSTLSITQDTGDPEDPGGGFYYTRYFDRKTGKNVCRLTDWEPTRETRSSYYLADLYTYKRKRVEHHV